jgi:hypothetical protein
MARHCRCVTAAIALLLALAGCNGTSGPPGESAAEAACRARGLTPYTAAFAACVDPAAAPVLQRAEQSWEDLKTNVEE